MSANLQFRVYSNNDELPESVEQMFNDELADSRAPKPDGVTCQFVTICVFDEDDVLVGRAHMDVCPIGFGPLKDTLLAYLEHLLVIPQHRGKGVGTMLLNRAVDEAAARNCDHIQFNVSWDNPAEIAVARKAGFAMACLEDGGYFVTKPTPAKAVASGKT